MLAREFHQQSSLGLILNEIGDVFSDAFIYLPFCLITGVSTAVVVWIVLLAIISEMAGVIAIQLSGTRRYDGPMGKSDRAFAFSVMSILLALGLKSHSIINFLFIIILVLLGITIFNRCNKALQETKVVS
jgi:CDP-diacylglycerol--glycerol-3-phosphate 3-phosphatidyltransferase